MPSEEVREFIRQFFADHPDLLARCQADHIRSNSNGIGILSDASSISNDSGDLPSLPSKSPPLGNLEIAPPTPTLQDRLHRANQTIRCHHIKSNGIRCGSPALHDEIYCYFHHIWRTEPECFPHRPDPNGALYKLPLLEDANGVQMAIQQVLDSVLSSKLDLRRAGILLYGLQTAAANLRRTTFEPFMKGEISLELK